MADRITCEPSPGRGYVGDLPTLAHSVNGFLYVRDNKTLVIEDFAYDGLGPGKVKCIGHTQTLQCLSSHLQMRLFTGTKLEWN